MISTSTERSNLPQFLLVTHLSQTLFALVRCHLVALTLLAAGHGTSFRVVR
jgi:hypothetical protein